MESTSTEVLERRVLEAAKAAEERNDPPSVWAVEASRFARESGAGGVPNLEMGRALVAGLCFSNNTPAFWKYLEQALASRLLCPLHVLSLLTPRIIPHRQTQPEAYRLYLELLSRYALSFSPMGTHSCREKIKDSVDEALQLSSTYGVNIAEYGHAVVFFLFSVVISLIDSTLEDWGIQSAFSEKYDSLYVSAWSQEMDIDVKMDSNDKRNEHREHLRRTNALMAIEMVGLLTANKKSQAMLRLVHLNLPEKFDSLLQRLQLLKTHISSENLISSNNILVKLFGNIEKVLDGDYRSNKRKLVGVMIDIGSRKSVSCLNFQAGHDTCWVPLDIYMESAMDGKQFPVTSAIDVLSELIKTLQVINQASWQETFQALWVSGLRLVQRDHDPLEGPVPHLDARLCVLLTFIPLAIARVCQDDGEKMKLRGFSSLKSMGTGNETSTEGDGYYPRRRGLMSSLQVLGQFSSLLSPPASVAAAANAAAVKAAAFVSNLKKGTDGYNSVLQNEVSFKAVGNMRHLVVEACIARKLIDTSAYLWPGYVSASVVSVKDCVPLQESSWSTFMKGAELTGPLINALRATPASSLLELERLYHIALSGSEEEKSAAGKILCGASLVRGWNIQIPMCDGCSGSIICCMIKLSNPPSCTVIGCSCKILLKFFETSGGIQEHVVHLVVKLLSPPAPPDFSGPGSYLVSHMSILSAILFGLSSVDTVHILSLFGMVPEVAAALVPLCEAFGSILPTSHHQSTSDCEPSSYMIFSCAFLFLLRLWKFYRPPFEHCMSARAGPTCIELNLEYLLLLHNNRVALHSAIATDRNNKDMMPPNTSLAQPLYIESFPKLRSWYSQNQACIASTLSGVCSGNPVHQVANKILNMIYWKMTKGDNVSTSMSGSTESSCEEAYQRPVLPAWEVLEALPLVLEAVLAACAYGRLSSRDLITGLRDLIDYLPASLATIISYFSAEITRGIWKPVLMNGTDWPSPAAYLPSIESEIKEILASVGVDVPNCHAGGTAPVMLPLPMAVLVSLTITFKLDKRLEYIHAVAGSAMENCAMGCPWSSMPIIGALWAQKVRRWHDFIVISCSRSPFRRDPEATSQLMRSCFTSFLGSPHASTSMLEASGRGVNGLLGRAISSGGVRLPIAPGLFYLRTCRTIPDTHYIDSLVLRLVTEWTHGLGSGWACGLSARLMQGRTSLASAAAGVKETATLGASLICVAGGIPLVQVLYEETMPTWLMSRRVYTDPGPGPTARILEGYAMAYLMILSGAFMWGLGGFTAMNLPVHLRQARAFHGHVEFMVAALEGSVSLGCDPATWKAYVSCFVGLLVGFVPAWIVEVKPEMLKRLAAGLRGWHECELALALLERGGQSVMASAVELIL